MVSKKDSSKLNRTAWIAQGLKLLGTSGIDAVRVEPLAKMMQVTKGSFYWHFKNRAEFLTAILDTWINQQTLSIIEQVEGAGGTPDEKLKLLFELAIQDEGREEIAIRAWATRDANVAGQLLKVDQQRLDYTQKIFIEIGFTRSEALVRARMAYYALVGEFVLGVYPGAYANPSERLADIRHRYQILVYPIPESKID